MTREQAVNVVAYLNAAFPREAMEPESVSMWISDLEGLARYDAAMEAAAGFRNNSPAFPAYSDFRSAYRSAADRLNAGRELEETFVVAPPPPDFVETWERIKRDGIGRSMSFTSTADIPVSESITPRPVYARLMRRRDLVELLPPSDEEKHDAILVLHDWCHMGEGDLVSGDAAMVVVEAQRIMDEASAA